MLEIILSTLQLLDKEQTRLIKKRTYFICKKKDYIIYNYLGKRNIDAILEGLIKNNNSQKKD